MVKVLPVFLILILMVPNSFSQSLLETQLDYERVREARDDYDARLSDLFANLGMDYPPAEIYLRAFKFDKELELWARDGEQFRLVKTYPVCSVSGELGPKRRQGDKQIPEGFYFLESFNPVSKYHLSLKVDYPNASDRILGKRGHLGGDIFIHGDCVTVGCLPIENEPVKELYWLALQVRQNGGSVPIHIFPFRMDEGSLKFFARLPVFTDEHWQFWNQLLPAYDFFENHHLPPVMSVGRDGAYTLNKDLNPVNN